MKNDTAVSPTARGIGSVYNFTMMLGTMTCFLIAFGLMITHQETAASYAIDGAFVSGVIFILMPRGL
jgi:putative Mn2+ efflux pump MntP